MKGPSFSKILAEVQTFYYKKFRREAHTSLNLRKSPRYHLAKMVHNSISLKITIQLSCKVFLSYVTKVPGPFFDEPKTLFKSSDSRRED